MATNTQTEVGMPGFLAPIWETVFRIATWSALIFGTLSIGSAFVSAWVGWEITDATQRDAEKRIIAADEQIKSADVRIAEATARAAEANQKAEEERLARVKLEAKIAPRRITQAQQQAIADKLLGFKNQRVALGAMPSTSQNEWLVRWLGAALKMGGWEVEIHTGDAANIRHIPDGVLVESTRHPISVAAAARVADAFNAEGIHTVAMPMLDWDGPMLDWDGPMLDWDGPPISDPSAPATFRLLIVVGDKPVLPEMGDIP